jgi:hypothetical protein
LAIGTREETRPVLWRDVGRGGLRPFLAGNRLATPWNSRSRAESCAWALPGGLIGSAILIIVLEWMCIVPEMLRIRESNDRVNSSWLAAGRAAAGPESAAEILSFGDSLIKLGILPRVLQDRLGWSAHNLAVLGGQAPTSYYLLRRVLGQGHRPRALIINFSPLLLAMDPRVNLEWWSTLPDGCERLGLLCRARDPALTTSMAVQGLIASWSARDAVRSLLGLGSDRVPQGSPITTPEDARVFERNWRMNCGAQVAPRHFVPIEGALPKPYEGSHWRWRPHPAHAFYVERFLNLAAAHRIPVFWVLTPAMSSWLDRNDEVGTIGAYRQFVRDNVPRFPGLIVLDAQCVGWDRSAFRDPIHLNRDGAVRLTLAVAESIERCTDRSSDGSRWLKLDGDADQSSDRFQDLLEDIDQSRAAVSQRESRPGIKEGSR